jgi:hypothetical protein
MFWGYKIGYTPKFEGCFQKDKLLNGNPMLRVTKVDYTTMSRVARYLLYTCCSQFFYVLGLKNTIPAPHISRKTAACVRKDRSGPAYRQAGSPE